MLRKLLIAALAVAIAASADGQVPAPAPSGIMSPEAAVAAAAANPRDGKRGTFEMLVRSTGTSHGHVFLNSEADYRDPNNLSVDLDVRATKSLERQLGAPADQFYKGKSIVVRGTARRMPVLFFDDYGRPTGNFYYQTHVPVREPGQITIAPAAAN